MLTDLLTDGRSPQKAPYAGEPWTAVGGWTRFLPSAGSLGGLEQRQTDCHWAAYAGTGTAGVRLTVQPLHATPAPSR